VSRSNFTYVTLEPARPLVLTSDLDIKNLTSSMSHPDVNSVANFLLRLLERLSIFIVTTDSLWHNNNSVLRFLQSIVGIV
jgi:hypothetical protein